MHQDILLFFEHLSLNQNCDCGNGVGGLSVLNINYNLCMFMYNSTQIIISECV